MKKEYEKPCITIETFSITNCTSANISVSNTVVNMDCLNDEYNFVYDNNY